MGTDLGRSGSMKSNPKGHFAIIGSLAVLAVVLSPLTPMPGLNAPKVEDDALLFDCLSLGKGIENVISGDMISQTGNNFSEIDSLEQAAPELSMREMSASASLTIALCGRPDLVQATASTHSSALHLVAYGCESAAGTKGYDGLSRAITDYQDVYCASAIRVVEGELGSWSDSIKAFYYETIPPARENSADDRESGLISEAEAIAVNASSYLQEAQELLDSGMIYEATRSLETGITLFTAMSDRNDLQFLFE